MKFILQFLTWIMDLVRWFSRSKNRAVAFKYFRMGLAIAKQGAKFTKSDADDKGLLYISEKFEEATKEMPDTQKKKLASQINKDQGKLKDVSLDFDLKNQKIKAGVGPANIEYDPKDGSAKFSIMGLNFSL